jgi:hypothetical protein
MEKNGKTSRRKTKGYKVIGMTNSSATEIRKSKKNGLTFDYYTCDAIALKPSKRQPNYCCA